MILTDRELEQLRRFAERMTVRKKTFKVSLNERRCSLWELIETLIDEIEEHRERG